MLRKEPAISFISQRKVKFSLWNRKRDLTPIHDLNCILFGPICII